MERYKVVKTIGDGAFGTVSKALVKATGEVVAIKKIKRKFLTWEECFELSEIRVLRKLVHPCIIRLREVVRQDADLHLVFDFHDKSIVQVMQSQGRPFTDAEARTIVFDVLQALAYMHRNGYFHRDVKPDNVLMRSGRCKLSDFGQAKDMRAKPPFTAYVSTRWYRAPEVLLHASVYTSAIDVFAAGCVWAELYLARPLFPGTGELDQLAKVCSVLGTPSQQQWPGGYRLAQQRGYTFPQVPAMPLSQVIPNAPPEAIALMSEMLQWNPAHRASAESLLQRSFFSCCSLDGPPPSIFPAGVQMQTATDLLRRSPSRSTAASIRRLTPAARSRF